MMLLQLIIKQDLPWAILNVVRTKALMVMNCGKSHCRQEPTSLDTVESYRQKLMPQFFVVVFAPTG